MDIFIEKIIEKKKDARDYAIIAGIIAAAIIAILIIPAVPYINSFWMLFDVLILYGAFRLIKMRNIEYEYSITNGEIDIDMIIDKRKRKRIISADCKDFEILSRPDSEYYKRNAQNYTNRIEAVTSMNSPDVCFFAMNREKERVIVFFEPDERMINAIKTYIPSKVFI